MASIGEVIGNRLTASVPIVAAASGNILADWRDDLVPAVVYDLELEDKHEQADGNGPETCEAEIVCVAATKASAVALADLVRADLVEGAKWTDAIAGHRVLGSFYRDREENSLELAGKKRLATVTLRYELIVAPVLLLVTGVVSNGIGEYRFTFNYDVATIDDPSDDNLQLRDPGLGWVNGVLIDQVAANVLSYGSLGGAINCTEWRIGAQPQSILTPVASPQSGVIV